MITLIAGTNRAGSRTKQITQHIEAIYAELKVPRTVLDLGDLPMEVFASSAYAEKPKSFQSFAETVLQSTGLVVITPEYNGGVPGILKYFIDLLKFPESFCKRPVCFVGLAAGQWGALRPVEQLQQIFSYRNAFIYPERVFIPHINAVLDDAGHLTNPEIFSRLKSQAVGFVEFVECLQGVKLRGKC